MSRGGSIAGLAAALGLGALLRRDRGARRLSADLATTRAALVATEAALAAADERLDSLVAHHPHAVLRLDLEGAITAANPAAVSLTGYPLDDLLTMTVRHLVVPDHAESATLACAAAAGREARDFESTIARHDGRLVAVSVVTVPLVVGAEVAGIWCIAEDITRHKALKSDLERARDAAEQASEAKAFFLANISHEIRTPLTSVLALNELLLDTDLDEEQTKMALVVERAGRRLLRLVNDILDFSRMQAGKTTLEVEDFDLRALVGEAVSLVGQVTAAQGLEITASVAGDVPHLVRGDPERILMVLTNLLGNAVKFTDHGYTRLSVERVDDAGATQGAAPVAAPGAAPGRSMLRFEVADSGVGFDAEQRARLFKPFSQADASITRRFGGTGLGLVIAQELVTLMGGTIGATSTPGAGSTFCFVLPLVP